MADQEHLSILNRGVEVWNQWREEHPEIRPDFENASFRGFGYDLRGINFKKSNLRGVDIAHTNLSAAILDEADLTFAFIAEVDFVGASFKQTYFNMSDVGTCDFSKADLTKASMSGHFSDVNFREAKLNNAYLSGNTFESCNLKDTNLSQAFMGGTIFANIDLSEVIGLEMVNHSGPSTIGFDTIFLSKGRIPEKFLREAGLPNSVIEQIPALIGSLKPIDYYSCFISYSSNDESFAKRLYADLQSNNVRCWFAPHDMRIGDKIRPRIDESIHLYDKLLLILSEHSVASQWVEQEVETALGKELEGKPNVLFPIRLDEAVMQNRTGWASHIRLTRHIGDFTNWKNHDDYQRAFDRLLRDLKAEAETTEV